MIPQIENVAIGQEINILEQPTYTYKIDTDKNRIIRHTDGLEAMEQVIYKILSTNRYEYEIYNWNYGFDVSGLIGKPKDYVYSELKRKIIDALTVDDRIISVDNFEFKTVSRDVVQVNFTVTTIYGDINTERQVNL